MSDLYDPMEQEPDRGEPSEADEELARGVGAFLVATDPDAVYALPTGASLVALDVRPESNFGDGEDIAS